MIVDKSWFVFDINMGSLVLQRLGFFSNIALKHTTNSIQIWRNILNPDKMMDGEALTVLLEWTIHGNSSNDELGLPEAHSKTWLVCNKKKANCHFPTQLHLNPPCLESKHAWKPSGKRTTEQR